LTRNLTRSQPKGFDVSLCILFYLNHTIKTINMSPASDEKPGIVAPANEFDVICARGLQAKNHVGNRKFKQKIKDLIPKYSAAGSRLAKSAIVSEVLNWVRSSGGEFIRIIDGNECQPVGDHLAREKIGQAFRDSLHSKYKSSTKAKRQRWRMEKLDKEAGRVSPEINIRSEAELKALAMSRDEATEKMLAARRLMSQDYMMNPVLAPNPEFLDMYSAYPSSAMLSRLSPTAGILSPAELEAVAFTNHKIMQQTHDIALSNMRRRRMLGLENLAARESLASRMFTQANIDMLRTIKTDPRFQMV